MGRLLPRYLLSGLRISGMGLDFFPWVIAIQATAGTHSAVNCCPRGGDGMEGTDTLVGR